MSALPDPAELAPSRDPAAYGRKPLFTATFFAWISLCLLCLTAGWAVARFGVQVTPAVGVETTAPVQSPPKLAPPPSPTTVQPPPTAGAPGSDAAALAALQVRVASLEATANVSAAGALAAADLSEAAQGSAPFAQDVAADQRLLPNSPDLAALAPLAAQGAPSRTDLAASLPAAASDASAAAHEPGKDSGLVRRLMAWVGRVVIIRRIDPKASGVDGILARAQAEASAGNLEGAVAALQSLPPAARPPLAPWIAAAQRRIEIDRRIEAIRAGALAALTPSGPLANSAARP